MTFAAKHFDPQLGIDIHTYVAAPSTGSIPIPTPHIGIVFDPFDYIPTMGCTVYVGGVKCATAGTGGLSVHIPVTQTWVPVLNAPQGPQHGDEIFMGSSQVSVDGEPLSRLGIPVLSCNVVGRVAPLRARRPKESGRSLQLPTTLNVAIPTNVFVGGPPTMSWTAPDTKGRFAGFGRFPKRAGPSAVDRCLNDPVEDRLRSG